MKRAKDGEPFNYLIEVLGKDTPDCIKWKYAVKGAGYGIVSYCGVNHSAHRLARLLFDGMGDSALEASHSCGNKLCINIYHISWKTHTENIGDKIKHGTKLVGEMVPGSKLTKEQVLKIRDDKRLLAEISTEYGISPCQISLIRRRLSWKWL